MKSSIFVITALLSTVYTVYSFTHPGVLLSKAQLDFVKTKINSGIWKTAYDSMKKSYYASLSYTPKTRKIVECGSYSKPNNGCTDERESALAAYTHALIWYYTGNKANAKKAIEIMDAWAATNVSHNNSNAKLQTGWVGVGWGQAAEIIKHTDAGWAADKVKAFGDMLSQHYLPLIRDGIPDYNGNWELIMMNAVAGMAVFLDDKKTFDKAVEIWRKRVDAYIYIESDGDHPHAPPGSKKPNTKEQIVKYWFKQSIFKDGVAQETCRDFTHTQMGIAAAINLAETARHQGLDLYKEKQERFVKGMEFHANILNGAPPPSWLCHGKLDAKSIFPMWEIAYSHYHGRMKVEMPHTRDLIKKLRPAGTDTHFVAWQTLTHGDNPN